jgi:hypothetical protein
MFLRLFINYIPTFNDIPYGVIYSTDKSATSTLTIEVSNSDICVVLLANMVHIFYIRVDAQSSIKGLLTWHHTVCCKMLVNSQKTSYFDCCSSSQLCQNLTVGSYTILLYHSDKSVFFRFKRYYQKYQDYKREHNEQGTAWFSLCCLTSLSAIFQLYRGGVPGENHRPVAGHWQTFSLNVVSSTPRNERCLIDTDCTGSCTSNYHTITTTTPWAGY